MMYEAGDKVQIKSWEELVKDYKTVYYELTQTLAIKLPNGWDFSRDQYDRITSRCENRIDTIEKVDNNREWFYLEKSKIIVTGYVIKNKVVDEADNINDRFEIMDL